MYTSVAEVFVLRYVIPIAISNRAIDIKKKIDQLILKLSSSNYYDSDRSKRFSVTDWFFVSTYIAKKRPDIPESSIVLAYRSIDPNDINRKFNKLIALSEKKDSDDNDAKDRGDIPQFHVIILNAIINMSAALLNGITLMTLQIGVLPEFIQVLIVRLTQVTITITITITTTITIDINVTMTMTMTITITITITTTITTTITINVTITITITINVTVTITITITIIINIIIIISLCFFS